jgi:hypothetical protein
MPSGITDERRGFSTSTPFLAPRKRLYITVGLSLSVPVAVIPVPGNIGTAVSPSLQNVRRQVPQHEDYIRIVQALYGDPQEVKRLVCPTVVTDSWYHV